MTNSLFNYNSADYSGHLRHFIQDVALEFANGYSVTAEGVKKLPEYNELGFLIGEFDDGKEFARLLANRLVEFWGASYTQPKESA